MKAVKFKKKNFDCKIIIRGMLILVLTGIILFSCAGRLDYWQGWIYLAANVLSYIMTVVIMWDKTELAEERLKPGEGVKIWDKVVLVYLAILFFIQTVLGGLDAGRFGWSAEMPAWAVGLGFVIFMSGQIIFLRAKAVNRNFSSVVRIQEDRGHSVCSDGPYRFVRHPGYSGSFLYMLATPFILGSLWAAIPMVAALAGLIVRTYMEDDLLHKDLPGYAGYASTVRYRLFPGIW